MFQKLLAQNVSGKFVKAIQSMYMSVRACIRHNEGTSKEWVRLNSGVKQGDPSSPIIFMMFVNDIVENINSDIEDIFSTDDMKLFILMFADDQVLFSSSAASLQSMLNDVQTYCDTRGLTVNINKTKVMIFEK